MAKECKCENCTCGEDKMVKAMLEVGKKLDAQPLPSPKKIVEIDYYENELKIYFEDGKEVSALLHYSNDDEGYDYLYDAIVELTTMVDRLKEVDKQ